jgi:hypothetical protein
MDQDQPNLPPNPEEDKNAIADYYEGYQKLELGSAEARIKKARNAIFAIAIVFLVSELIGMAAAHALTTAGIVITAGIAAIFVGLGFLTKKQPLTAILIALILFVGLWILAIIVTGPEQIYKGILVRGIIIYFLVTGIKHAREAERIRKQMNVP